MRKLSLESLSVESFSTTDIEYQRGTVAGHVDVPAYPETTGPPDNPVTTSTLGAHTYDGRECGATNYMDCTYGCSVRCSYQSRCDQVCWIESYEPGEPAIIRPK